MAAQHSKPQEVVINLKAEVQKLKELRDAMELLKQEGKLANTNENTYKSLFNQIEQAIKRMNDAIKDGSIGAKGLMNIQKGFDGIATSLNKMISQEKSTGLGMQEYVQLLDKAQKKVDELQEKIKNLQKNQANINVTDKGHVKKGQEGDVMAAARKRSRNERGNKGGDTKAEAMLKSGDLKTIQAEAAAGNKDAQKALALYNDELAKQHDYLLKINDQLADYKDQLSAAKAELSQLKSTSAFDEGAVKDMETASSTVEKTGASFGKLGKQMEQTNTTSVKVSKSMEQTQSSAARAAKSFIKFNVVLKVAKNLLKEGIKSVIEMDQALTDMAIVTGTNRDVLQQMIPTFNKLGRETGATATEVAGLTAEYMKQGRTMKDSMILAEQTAKAAKISGLETAETLEYLTAAINGFNLAASDAAHVNDVFAKLGAVSATDYEDLAIALSKVSAQANTAGMSIEFTTALLAKGLETTQEAPESIGTALKTILARMRELSDYGSTLEDGMNVNKVEAALGAVGVALRDTNGQFRDMEEIFNELGPQWDNLTSMQQQAIAQAVAGTRQQSRFLAIMQDWDRTVELSSASLDADGAAMAQHAKYAESLQMSIDKLKTAWQGFISGLTDSNLIRDTFSFLAEALSKFVDFINFLNEHSGGLVGTGATLLIAGGALLSLVRERVNAMREEKELRRAQLEQIREEQARQLAQINQEKEKTDELQKQLSVREKLKKSQDEEYKTFKERLAESVKAGAESGAQKKVDKTALKEAKQREKSLLKLQKLEQKERKEKQKHGDKETKTTKKREKELTKFKEKEAKRLEKARKKQEAILEKQKAAEEEIKKKLEDQTLSAEQKNKLLEQQSLQQKAIAVTNKNITDIKTQEGIVEEANLTTSTTELAIDQQDAAVNAVNKEIEEQTTNEEGEQIIVKSASLGIEKAENTEKGKGLILSIKERLEDTKDAIIKGAGAFAESVKSLGMPAGAIAGAAVLAVIGGIIGASISANTGAKGAAKRDEKMAANQTAIYEAKEKKNSLLEYKSEYEELNNKAFKTSEEMERMKEIEEALQEIDGSLTGTGDDLLNSIDKQTDILDKEIASLVDANFVLASKNASSGYMSEETKLALRQKAQMEAEQNLADNTELSSGDKAVVANTVQSMFGQLSDEEYKEIFNREGTAEDKAEAKERKKERKQQLEDEKKELKERYKRGEISKEEYKEKKKQLKAAKKDVDDAAMLDEVNYEKVVEQVTDATAKIYAAESENLATQLKTYNESLEGLDDTAKAMLERQFADLAMLAQYEGEVAQILSDKSLGIAESGLRNFAKTLSEAGASAEGFQAALQAISTDGFSGLVNMSDAELAQILGVDDINSPEFQQQKDKILLQALYDLTGMNSSTLKDARTNLQSQAENVNDLQGKLISGEKLTQEDEEYLASNFGDLWANAEFQASLKGDGVYAAKMIEEATGANRAEKQAQAESLISGQKDLLAEKYGSFDTLSKMSKDELISQFGEEGAADIIQRLGQIYSDQANLDAIKDFTYEYEGLNKEALQLEQSTARYEALQEEIDKKGIGTLDDYKELAKAAKEVEDINRNQLNNTVAKLKETLGEDVVDSILTINEATGEVVVNWDEYATLSGVEKEIFDAQLETIKEQNEALAEQKKTVEEIAQMERDAQVEIQNQAIDAMKARLEAEYDATKESLNKRRELYDKYFDALEQEEDEETYEQDRQALLNKIAALSTASDSESLAKLKEAQEALQELDDEKLESEREFRREAVNESFDKQEEGLDAAYDDAMANVQGLWEEFCTMAGEDQLALFQQYGEGFQEVTDLQKEIAQETLDELMTSINSFGFSASGTNSSTPAYAEGGLVDYTGPAWVDGTKSRPEAFLDAVDTANIANLAQGLRALISNSVGVERADSSSSVTINELNINVTGGADAMSTGREAADGFIKAIRDLGININKKD